MPLLQKNVYKYFLESILLHNLLVGGMMEAKSKEIEINDITPDTFNSKKNFPSSKIMV